MDEIKDEEELDFVEKKVTNNNDYKPKILVIGVGQGGSRVATQIGMIFKVVSNNVYINTSEKDIKGLANVDPERTIKIGNGSIEGTGKDRAVALALLKSRKDTIFEKLTKYALEQPYDFIFCAFSTAGGTGSGMGPNITAMLNSNMIIDEFSKKYEGKKPIVFGLAALPELSSNEGNISFQNTLESLENINKLVSNSAARFILINNGGIIPHTKMGDRVAHLKEINVSVGTMLYRYICQYGTSRTSNLDRADRIGALNCMGLHSFIMLDAKGERASYSPFFLPDGERVLRVCYEVPEDMENAVAKVIERSGVVVDDSTHALYDNTDNDNTGLAPIVAFHGYKNVAKIAEQYDKKLKLNRENASRIESSNLFTASGLDNVKEERNIRDDQFGHHGVDSLDDIFD